MPGLGSPDPNYNYSYNASYDRLPLVLGLHQLSKSYRARWSGLGGGLWIFERFLGRSAGRLLLWRSHSLEEAWARVMAQDWVEPLGITGVEVGG